MPRKEVVQRQSQFVPSSARAHCYYCGKLSETSLNNCILCFHRYCNQCWGEELPLPGTLGLGEDPQPLCISCSLLATSFPPTFLCSASTGNGAQVLLPGTFLGLERRRKRRMVNIFHALVSACSTGGGDGGPTVVFDTFPASEVCLVAWRPLNRDTKLLIGAGEGAMAIPLSRITSVSIAQRCRCLVGFSVERTGDGGVVKDPLRVVFSLSVGECDHEGYFCPDPKSTQSFAGTLSMILEHFKRNKMCTS
eukprot:PhF_6_TR17350/c0_g1_i1/m.26571